MEMFQTLNDVIEDGSFSFKTYGEATGAYMHQIAYTGLTETEKELVVTWFGDRYICSIDPEKFQKYFDRLWNLYAWQYRNMAAAWFGTNADDFKKRIIGEFSGENFDWNGNFLINVDTAINGKTSNTQETSGTTSGITNNGGSITNTGTSVTSDKRGGSDVTTTDSTSNTEASGTNNSTTEGSTSGTNSSTTKGETSGTNTNTSTTEDTKLAGSTTKNKSINKTNPMSIVNSGASGDGVPTLDWTYATGQDASESTTTPDGKTDTTKNTTSGNTSGTSDSTVEGSNSGNSDSTTTGKTSNTSDTTNSGKNTVSYGATDDSTTTTNNKQDINTNTTTNGNTSGKATGSGTSDTTNNGRTATLAALYGEFLSLMQTAPAWKWMMDKIEPAFLSIYDI